MTEARVPDPTLMARLQLSVKGVDWAASLLEARQHHAPPGVWTAHQHLFHLLAIEVNVFQPRIRRVLVEAEPVFQNWDSERFMEESYHAREDVTDLADKFMVEREKTVAMLKAVERDQWRRTAAWPDGRVVDLAWIAERVLWHALDHFAGLLELHGDLEAIQAPRWFGEVDPEEWLAHLGTPPP